MEVYRITADSPAWLFKAYDYVRTDAFVFGQGIPVNFEFSHDEPIDEEYKAVALIEDGKPIAGCRITFPKKHIGKIGRVCVIREYQRKGVGKILIDEAEKWITEDNVANIVINSQDRALGFYEKLGYRLVPGVNPQLFEEKLKIALEDIPRDYEPKKNDLGFSCVLVEKLITSKGDKVANYGEHI